MRASDYFTGNRPLVDLADMVYLRLFDLKQGIEGMPRFDEVTRGVTLGIGIAILIPVALKTLAPVLRPVVRSAVKGSVRAVEKGREILAETSEKVEDLVAETRAEMRAERLHAEDTIEPAATEAAGAAPAGQHEDPSNVRNIVNE